MQSDEPARRSIPARIFLSPDERRLRAGWRILGQFLLLIIFSLFFGSIFGLLSFVTPVLSGDTGLLLGELISLLAITASIFLARWLLDRRSFASLGLKLNGQAAKDLLFGILLTGVLMGLVYVAEWAAGWLKFENFSWQVGSPVNILAGTLVMLGVFLIVGWQEELLSRGYWLQNFSDGLNLFWGVLLSSLLFALMHLGNPNVSWVAILGLIAAGFFLAYGYVRTRQLWLSIGLHIGWNFFEGVVFGFQVSGLSGMPTWIVQSVKGPVLVTGGKFGPEAGLIILPVLLLGAAAIYVYTCRHPIDSTAAGETGSAPTGNSPG